ncbi:Cell-division control histidine kinase pdhS [Mesorhizobium metallidurans STM 2683]|uniref:histidine kinase n=1 Tax=Mesorhizobium metallidurans STM 2683 TaxID=1297569 RepID=M5EX54_9HYPH|nr:PAS domain S-box protein [Mesorhizobium metallidurans]CCV08565.1 Cell-division control histidine kinase pdhS [Mesorhizobium metallidurans STM 2683]
MPSENYSFLDVAVLDAVRQRFAAGDAIAVLPADLEQVIWANGPGAAVFGYPDIEAIIGSSAGLPMIARRQIMATSGFPEIGRDRAITVRLATGLTSRAIGFLATAITMPDGENAIMLAVPAAQAGSRNAAEIADRAISGFTEDGHFIAFVDAKGGIEAASDGFSALGILPETLAALVADVTNESERIVKRLVPGGATSYPAGLARLTDERHLLVVIDEDRLDSEALGDGGPVETEAGADTATDAVPPIVEAASAEHDIANATERSPQTADSARPAPGGTPAQHDHWYFSASEDETREPVRPEAPLLSEAPAGADIPAQGSARDIAEPAYPAEPPTRTIDRAAAPLRFVWRTDAEGKFSALSPEFAEIVGKPAADVIGRRFRDVAAAFGLDASGEIAGLLERRDTWSGRSVLWPVAGTDLKIPVDLAALPVYGRSRAFEGFRGFGVARTGDAAVDPEAIGMALVPNDQAPAAAGPEITGPEITETVPEAPKETDPFKGEVPALTIVPKPERRFADKVIRLAEHRQPANDKGLSTLERSAFREIGERLRKENVPVERADVEKPAELVAEPAETNSEDEKDIARLDGKQPDAAVQEQPEAVQEQPGPSAVSNITGSLLNYADRDHVADNSDDAPRSEPDKAEAQEIAQPTGTDSRSSASEAPRRAETTEDDDSMIADDFRDAEDSEDWARADSEETRPSTDDIANTDDVEPAPVGRPRLQVPPLKLEGFVPSAFFAGDDKAPDISILGKLPVPLLIHSGDDLHYANEEFLGLTGYDTLDDLEEAGGLGALFADPYDDSASDGTDHALRLKTRDGQEFPIEALLRAVPWRTGKALMLVVRRSGDDDAPPAALHGAADEQTQPDIPELKARIAEMRTIIDTATDGVVLIGRDGTIRSISRPAEALFGFDSDEVTGKSFVSLFAIESQRAARDYLDGLSEPGVASVLNDGREVIGREAQGRFIPLFMTIGRLPNDSGFCAVVRDITQWKRAEEDLTQARAVAERASSQKTDFLARISHEIRTPLNAIIGFSELMVDEKFGPVANDRYRDYLRDINRSGNHVLDLVNDLLDISKIEAGQQEMAYEAVSLNDTLAETVAMMQPQANRERVIIRSSFASRLPEVVADLRSVRQIALNILSNAIRYTQAGGQVIVSTAYEASGDVVMRVRDTGIGMSQSEIEQALKPFKQINALKRGRGDGTGLGLPLTKAMVEANRARFTINSTPGEGTLVEIAFPSTRVLAE